MEQSPSWEANRFLVNQEIPPNCMESEGSLPRLQEHVTCHNRSLKKIQKVMSCNLCLVSVVISVLHTWTIIFHIGIRAEGKMGKRDKNLHRFHHHMHCIYMWPKEQKISVLKIPFTLVHISFSLILTLMWITPHIFSFYFISMLVTIMQYILSILVSE